MSVSIRQPLAASTVVLATAALLVGFVVAAPAPALAEASRSGGSGTAAPSATLDGEALTPATIQYILDERERLERVARHRARERAAREAAREARAQEQYRSRWVMPIQSFTWSAGFGESGSMWSSGYHTGQDWTSSYGTPVYAAARGWITSAEWSDAYGNKLVITHDQGTQTWYAHLSQFQRTHGHVAAGQLVGYVGCTGNCYGNHLHFEVHPRGGEAVDPVAWLRRHRVAI
jgi:murein DD-endopeptidase MepM/ murein hydrolase activator NlpD